jgi:competence ComEA-like helix-hairpin-helix protein
MGLAFFRNGNIFGYIQPRDRMKRFFEFSLAQRKTLTLLGLALIVFGGYKIIRMSAPSFSVETQISTAAVTSEYKPPLLLDANRSPADSLELVPGIGPVLSERIIQYRRTHGAFVSVDSLVNVKGIGPKTLAKIRMYFRDIPQ